MDNDVLSLHVSKNDELWVGTSGGVSRLALSGRPFNNAYYTQRDGLPGNTVHGILSDKNNRIWFSTNNGLVMFNPSGKAFKSFDVNDGLQNNEFTDGAFYGSRLSGDLFFGGINGLDVIHPDRMDTTAYFSKLVINEFQVHNMILMASPLAALVDCLIAVAALIATALRGGSIAWTAVFTLLIVLVVGLYYAVVLWTPFSTQSTATSASRCLSSFRWVCI